MSLNCNVLGTDPLKASQNSAVVQPTVSSNPRFLATMSSFHKSQTWAARKQCAQVALLKGASLAVVKQHLNQTHADYNPNQLSSPSIVVLEGQVLHLAVRGGAVTEVSST